MAPGMTYCAPCRKAMTKSAEPPAYVCPQCGPDPRGGDVHAATRHRDPAAPEDVTPERAREWLTQPTDSVADGVS